MFHFCLYKIWPFFLSHVWKKRWTFCFKTGWFFHVGRQGRAAVDCETHGLFAGPRHFHPPKPGGAARSNDPSLNPNHISKNPQKWWKSSQNVGGEWLKLNIHQIVLFGTRSRFVVVPFQMDEMTKRPTLKALKKPPLEDSWGRSLLT